MSNFGLSCDVCNRENVGITWVNGMKFCAKCYKETFGNQKKYVDMLHKETGELLVNLLAEKDKQIAELQNQLEEKYADIIALDTDNYSFKQQIDNLRQQLKNQPAEIVEKIKQQLIKRLNTIAGYGRMTTDELSFLIETEFGSDLDTILKEYQK